MKRIVFLLLFLFFRLDIATGQSHATRYDRLCTGKFWHIAAFADTTFQDIRTKKMGISFLKNGQINGFAICNNISGRYAHSPGTHKLSFAGMNLTWRGCGNLMPAELYLLHILKQGNRYNRSGDTLTLYRNKKKLLVLVKRKQPG